MILQSYPYELSQLDLIIHKSGFNDCNDGLLMSVSNMQCLENVQLERSAIMTVDLFLLLKHLIHQQYVDMLQYRVMSPGTSALSQ